MTTARQRAVVALVLAVASLAAGCGTLESYRMLMPGGFGMEEIRPGLFVDPAMTAEDRQALEREVAEGRERTARFWGSLATAPRIVACANPECSWRFGSRGARAAAIGDGAIRLSHDGRSAALVAHEWSHAEVYRRIGGWWNVGRIPRWFDEGLAVVIADERRHDEANWAAILRRGVPRPKLDELVTRSDWIVAVQRYGETLGDHPDNLRVVYTTAGQAVREWLACAGPEGAARLVDLVGQGESFDVAWHRLGGACSMR